MFDFKAQNLLLAGISALALGISLAVPHYAAADTTIISFHNNFDNSESNNVTITGSLDAAHGEAFQNTISMLTLSNFGIISSGTSVTDYGIFNIGSIRSIINTGTIDAGFAVQNGFTNGTNGTIGTLTNSGTITGTHGDAINSYGTINLIENLAGGTLSSLNFNVIFSAQSIGTLSNAGLIDGVIGFKAIYNQGNITELDNSGIISGANTGIYNSAGSIATLTNSGTINLPNYGVYNTGMIGSLTNSGTIATVNANAIFNNAVINAVDNTAGGTLSADTNVIDNNGSIAALNNAGLISGAGNFFAIFNTGTITSLDNSGSINGAGGGVFSTGTGALAGLTNSGTISTGHTGIFNAGLIGGLTNTGVIDSNTGIANSGTIGTLSNSGTLSGATFAALYNTGSIDVLTNSGVMQSNNFGLDTQSDIGTLTNAAGGTIMGGETGLIDSGATIDMLNNDGFIGSDGVGASNSGTITLLSNQIQGVISGGSTAIANHAVIGGLANNGIVSGSHNAILNYGTISALSNSGTIAGIAYGIKNTATGGGHAEGTIGSLTNSGTISGGTAAVFSTIGVFGQIENTGLIAGNIKVSNQNLTITGGTGAQFGTLSGGTISLTPGDALEFAAGNQILADDVDLGASGTMTNDATLQIGTTDTTPSLNLTGNFVQNADGTLIVPIAPSQSSVLNVSGNASIAGHVVYDFAPGTYTTQSYEFITASSVTGAFAGSSTRNLPVNATTGTSYLSDPGVVLTVTAAPATTPVTPVTPAAPVTTTTIITTATTPATPVITATLPVTTITAVAPPMPIVVAPADDTIFSAQTEALAENTQQDMGLLLNKAEYGGGANRDVCAAATAISSASTVQTGTGSAARLAGTLGNAFCGAGGWVEATGSLMTANHGNGAPGYHADGGGFLAGLDRTFGDAKTRLGLALGYDQTRLTDGAGGTGSMGVVRVALYGAQPVGPVTLSGVISYGNASNATDRASGFTNLSEHYSANIYSGGAQASTNMQLGPLALVPAAGVRIATLGRANLNENATGEAAAFAVSGTTANYTSVQPFATVSLTHQFVTGEQIAISTHAKIGYEYQAGGERVITLLHAADGTQFHAMGNRLDPSDALVALGVAAGKKNWSVYADYGARVSGNWTAQTMELGMRVSF